MLQLDTSRADETALKRALRFPVSLVLPDLLYLEDSLLSRKLMAKYLDGVANVTCCATTAEARPLVASRTFQLVIADYQLVGEDAAVFINDLRAQFTHAELPLLAVSSSMDRILRGTVFGAGATAALRKPFVPDELRALVARLLAQPEPLWTDYVAEVPTITWSSGGRHYEYAPHVQLLREGMTPDEAHQTMHLALAQLVPQGGLPVVTPIGQAVHHFPPLAEAAPGPPQFPR